MDSSIYIDILKGKYFEEKIFPAKMKINVHLVFLNLLCLFEI